MESGIQSSFIPQDAAIPKDTPRYARGGGLSELILLFAIVILVASGALAGAVFLYSQYVQSSAASKVQQLQRAEAAFEPSLIQQLTRLDDRMTAGEQILQNHIAPSALFDILQKTTLSTVSFQTLDFEANDAQHMELKMTGVAESVNSIALEADLMSKSGIITSPIFSDITRQADGVHFSLDSLINPTALNYEKLLSAAAQPASAASTQTSAQQTIFGTQGNPPTSQTQQTQSTQQTQTQTPTQSQTQTAAQNQTHSSTQTTQQSSVQGSSAPQLPQ